jgi:outer membrane protein assembly factor BamB
VTARSWACYALPLLAATVTAGDGNWTQFRGPNGSGVDSATGYPVEFSPSKNVVWKKAVPYGQSSPVVVGTHLYFTASENEKLVTICLDTATGKELWRREIRRPRSQKIFKANDPASPTPVADESGVVSFFPDFGLAAYTADGKDRWTLPLGPFKNFYGMAASPILAGDLLILVCDQQSGSFILALDRASGRQRWKTARASATIGWATPIVFRPTAGQAQLIVLGSTRLDGYYLATGEPKWWMPVGSNGGVGTPVTAGDLLMVSTLAANEPWMPTFDAVLKQYDKDHDGRLSQQEFSGDKDLGEHFGWIDSNNDNFVTAEEWNVARGMGMGEYGAVAIRPDKAQGKLEPGAVQWRFKKNLPFIPAPLIYNDVFYMVRDGGIITSLNPTTGQLLKEGRSSEALGEYYASPIAADGKLFLSSTEGKITVVKAGADWQVLKVNDLGDEIHATPALNGGRVYVRTRSTLYCFGGTR